MTPWLEWAYRLLDGFNLLVLGYFLLLNTAYLATSLFAFKALRRYANRLKSLDVSELLAEEVLPPVTLIAPAYNEAATCVESVRSLLGLHYPEYEVLVVNDGSKDETLARLAEAFQLQPVPRAPTADIPCKPVREVYRSATHPRLWVVDKENGGKADALPSTWTPWWSPRASRASPAPSWKTPARSRRAGSSASPTARRCGPGG